MIWRTNIGNQYYINFSVHSSKRWNVNLYSVTLVAAKMVHLFRKNAVMHRRTPERATEVTDTSGGREPLFRNTPLLGVSNSVAVGWVTRIVLAASTAQKTRLNSYQLQPYLPDSITLQKAKYSEPSCYRA